MAAERRSLWLSQQQRCRQPMINRRTLGTDQQAQPTRPGRHTVRIYDIKLRRTAPIQYHTMLVAIDSVIVAFQVSLMSISSESARSRQRKILMYSTIPAERPVHCVAHQSLALCVLSCILPRPLPPLFLNCAPSGKASGGKARGLRKNERTVSPHGQHCPAVVQVLPPRGH